MSSDNSVTLFLIRITLLSKISKPKNYYKNQHKPRAQIFSINYLAQAIVSIIDSNPVKARSNPTILIKKDEDYTKVFNSEYDIKIFYYAILMRNRVSEYLKSIQKNKSDDAVLINIAKYYELHVTRVLASLVTKQQNVTPTILSHLKISDLNISDDKISDSIDILKKAIEYSEIDLSKKASLNIKLTEETAKHLENIDEYSFLAISSFSVSVWRSFGGSKMCQFSREASRSFISRAR